MVRPEVASSPAPGQTGNAKESRGQHAKEGATKPEEGNTSPCCGNNLTPQRKPQEMGPNSQDADGHASDMRAGEIDRRDLDTSKSVSLADWCCLLACPPRHCAATKKCLYVVMAPHRGKCIRVSLVFARHRGRTPHNQRERESGYNSIEQLIAVVPPVREKLAAKLECARRGHTLIDYVVFKDYS